MDYGIRAVVELAGAGAAPDRPVTAERLATAQDIPPKFLESILLQLRRGGVADAERICRCMYNELKQRMSFEEFKAADESLREGGQMSAELSATLQAAAGACT